MKNSDEWAESQKIQIRYILYASVINVECKYSKLIKLCSYGEQFMKTPFPDHNFTWHKFKMLEMNANLPGIVAYVQINNDLINMYETTYI